MAAKSLPERAQIVVVGGGIVGCSVLYHLAKIGATDCILLERNQISSGTTWHSAALVTPLRSSASGTELAKYSAALYANLEAETGQATGWRQCGHLNIAASKDRFVNLQHAATTARGMGIDAQMIGPDDIKKKWPLLKTDDLFGAIWMPASGRVNPTDICQALLKGARSRGAQFFENTPVTKFDVTGGKVRGVETPQGRIACDIVVNCTGLWGRSTSASVGVSAPLYACEHFYMLTQPIEGVHPMLPVVRDGDAYLYIREEVGGLLVGCFEPNARILPQEKIPSEASFFLMNEDWDHFEPMMENAMHRIPALENAQARCLINGPESFTTDHNPILGESPEVKNFFLACGMNSSGIVLSGGVGWAMAEWITKGRPPVDLWDSDARRYLPFQNNRKALEGRIPEVLSKHFSIPWPGKDYETVRGVRRSPLHESLLKRGAYFSQRGSWERAIWYIRASSTVPPTETYGKPSYFEEWSSEHRAARENVAIFDQSAFAKLTVQGRDAEKFLQRVCAGDLSAPSGKVVYTPLLNADGGIESDLTITRLDDEQYLAVTGSAQARRDADWLKRNINADEFVTVCDVTPAYASIIVTGPRSPDLLSQLTTTDLGNEAFPFGTAKRIEVGYAECLALRVSYAGELGWELHVTSDLAVSVFEALMEAAQSMPNALAGTAALNSLRLEKAFRSWGHDIGPFDNPFESGLMFAVKTGKADFIGRDAVLRQRDKGYRRRLVNFTFNDPSAYPHGQEPIYRGGELCGTLSSASYGHSLGRAIGMGWLKQGGLEEQDILSDPFEIEIGGHRHTVTPSLKPFYDPSGKRMRG
jgi:glycine cleavage system aminomethyltransferase T/glycine/D-amino acid oxidase-like deaminating enzyme